jgi:hypothetical protein
MTFDSVEQIFEEIESTRKKLVDHVSNLSDEEANFRPTPEKWSTANIVEHLAITENSLIRLVNKLLAKAEAENLPSTGKIDPPVSFVEIAEKAGRTRFEAPEAVRPGGAASIAQSLSELQKSRTVLCELRPRLEAVDLSNVAFPHPAFGAMNLYSWLAFIGLHEARHLRQIVEILPVSRQSDIDEATN